MSLSCQGGTRKTAFGRRVVPALVAIVLLVIPVGASAQHDHSGPLPHNIPDFCAAATISTVGSGSWSNPATWSPARVPAAGEVVNVSAGTDVSYDVSSDAAIACVAVNGRLAFRTDINTRLTAGTMMIMRSGELQVGTMDAPVAATVTAEIVVANQAINTATDPEQFGTGVIGLGTVTMHGALRTPTWTRLAVEPRAGQTSLTLSQPASGWRAGDRLILPDTRHLKWNEVSNWWRISAQWEELTVAAVSADGKLITLTQALRFDHLGARDSAGALRLLPHVGNLTRNVIVRSQAPIGGAGVQGHVLFTERATVDIRYAAFRDLGRTIAAPTGPGNQIGRYPMHFHHLSGPVTTPANGYQYTFVGNAIDGGSTNHRKRWGVAIHNTHYGLVSDNVLYNYGGALLTTEDGSESYNVIERNFAVRSSGTGGRLGEGNEGMGFWFRGPNNYVRGNVAADFDSDEPEAAYGYKYFMRYLGTVNIPTAKGQDPSQFTAVNGNALPVLEFKDNEVYSAGQGLTYWWLSSQDPTAVPNPKESVFEDLRIWHVFNVGVYHYPAARVRFERLLILGRDPASSACCSRGWHGEDYAATDIRIVNSEIQGMAVGVIPSGAGTGLQAVETSTLKNNIDVSLRTMYSANGGDWLPPRKTVLTNNKLLGSTAIEMDWGTNAQTNSTQTDELLVYGYQGNASDNFRVYYDVQASQNVAGGLAPCYATRAEIRGIVCSIGPNPVVTGLVPSTGPATGGTSVTISGANFAAGATVTFGAIAATSVVVNSASQITAVAPASAAGMVAVTVINPNGASATLAAAYSFIDQPCTYALSPNAQSFGAAGGSGSVSITALAGCSWSASSNAPWLTITAGSQGSGNGSVGFSVAANDTISTRSTALTIGGQTFSVTQQGSTCSYMVAPLSVSVAAGGGSASVSVTAQAGCPWTVTSNAPWITVTSSESGNGNDSVALSIAPNADALQRNATVDVAGSAVSVAQDAAAPAPIPCTYTVSPLRQSFGKGAGAGTISVTTPANCSWTATALATWITITAGASGTGSGTVSYSIASNSASGPRKGTITIADQVVRITQAKKATGRTFDFDGDGVADGLLFDSTTGAWDMEVATLEGFEAWSAGTWPAGATIRAGDFNADGLSDVLIHDPATGQWKAAVNTGTGAFTMTGGTWAAGAKVFVLDLTGDGRSDVFAYEPISGGWWKYITINSAPGTYSGYAGTWQRGLEIYPGEWNADLRADFLAYDPASGSWFKALNTTTASFAYVAGTTAWNPRNRLMIEDFGNGR